MQTEKIVRCVIILISTLCGVVLHAQNFTNRGTEFWVGYGHNQYFNAATSGIRYNTQEMVLYLSAEQEAHVTVSVPGTSWSKSYLVPANTAITTVPMPKGLPADGGVDARLLDEGLYKNNIFIKSDVPIAVFAHTYGAASSGATMLLPVEAYGYTYYSANTSQTYGTNDCYSWFYVVASEDNTIVRITPARPTTKGGQRNVPFDVPLKKGEVYNVFGQLQGGSTGYDMSGSKIQSIPGTDGNCHPIGVFSGSSRTGICMLDFSDHSGGDFMMQQVFPASAWGTRYLVALTSSTTGASILNSNRVRVYLRDLTTKVYRNGVLVAGSPVNNSYFEFAPTASEYITATKPVMVAQIIVSGQGCGTVGEGDPEMIYVSPMEQAINKVTFYNTNRESIISNYLTLAIPDNGLNSLKIDGSNSFDYVYAHPGLPGYKVVVKDLSVTPMQHTVESDSTFTGITYGLGQAESYGYNIGSYINNLAAIPDIKPVNSSTVFDYVCTKTPFVLSVKTIYQATTITLHFSKVANMVPATDLTIPNPVVAGTSVINGKTYYTYDLPGNYEFSKGGEYVVPISVTDPSIDNCNHSEMISITIPVHQGPGADFSVQSVCVPEKASFSYISISADARLLKWDFGDGTNSTVTNPEKKYAASGNYNVKLQVIRDADGCLGDTVKQLTILPLPKVAFQLPDVICMPEGKAAFINKTTTPDNKPLSYNWDFGDGGKSLETDPTHTYLTAATYAVKLKATTADGCPDSLTVSLSGNTFVTTPTADFTPSGTIFCTGKEVEFLNKSTYNSSLPTTWQWEFGNSSTSTEKEPATIYSIAKDYFVKLTVTTGGCVSVAVSHPLRIYAPPTVDAGQNTIISAGDVAPLQGTVNDAEATVKWTPFIYLSADNILNPVATPPATQSYYLTATGQTGCTSTDSVEVKVYNDIKIPNIFTPNGDGVNDFWEIKGLQDYHNATIDIYNRWGQRVYRITGGYNKRWDGSATGGTPVPAGTYYYVLQPGANGYGKITGSLTIVR